MTYAGQGQRVHISPMLNLLRDQHSLQALDDPLCHFAVPFRRNRTSFFPAGHQSRQRGRQLARIGFNKFVRPNRDGLWPVQRVNRCQQPLFTLPSHSAGCAIGHSCHGTDSHVLGAGAAPGRGSFDEACEYRIPFAVATDRENILARFDGNRLNLSLMHRPCFHCVPILDATVAYA